MASKTSKQSAKVVKKTTVKKAAAEPAILARGNAPMAKSVGGASSAKVKEVLAQLKALGNASVHARNARDGAGDNQYGVQMGDLRKVAQKLKADHDLGLGLWATGNLDARLLAVLLITPERLASKELDRMVREATFAWLADWLNSYVVKQHADKETLRATWMKDKDPWAARAGWNLTAERVAKSPDGLDLDALLDRIESEMGKAHAATQWTMNSCLAQIGITAPKLRKRAVAIGEKLGVYRDYPVSKGCTSPFAPIWIDFMVQRQAQAPKPAKRA
jgi:3-methyladenine DNA glycosylase AlkD